MLQFHHVHQVFLAPPGELLHHQLDQRSHNDGFYTQRLNFAVRHLAWSSMSGYLGQATVDIDRNTWSNETAKNER